MRFVFTVTAEVEHDGGQFVAHAELAHQLRDLLDNADPGTVFDHGTYTVTAWTVEQVDEP